MAGQFHNGQHNSGEGVARAKPGQGAAPVGEVLAGLRGRPILRMGMAWRDAVGPMIAAHTRVLSVSAGTVRIEVDSQEWRLQLENMTAVLLNRLRDAGFEEVQKLSMRVRARPHKPPIRQVPAAAVDPAERDWIDEAVEPIGNTKLKEAFRSLLMARAQAQASGRRKS